jgi:predicted O-methyltransferase YrrM
VPGKPTHNLKPEPLLARAAAVLLGALADGEVFEFGSGGSTLFLAQRAVRLISVEHDADWAAAVRDELARHLLQAEVRVVETGKLADSILGEGQFDLVFVDCFGPQRGRAIANSARHVKPGGWLAADDCGENPRVRRGVDRLIKDGWDVGVVAGVKVHAVRGPVKTETAFCHKPEVI